MPAKIVQVCQSRRENDHITEIASLMEGEWSCHGGGLFNGENGHVTEVVTLMKGE